MGKTELCGFCGEAEATIFYKDCNTGEEGALGVCEDCDEKYVRICEECGGAGAAYDEISMYRRYGFLCQKCAEELGVIDEGEVDEEAA